MVKHLERHEARGEFVNWDAYREMKRQVRSEMMIGNKHGVGPRGPQSEEQKQAHSVRMRGRKQTPESNAKRSASHKARWAKMTPEEREQWIEQSIPSGDSPSSLEKIVAKLLDGMGVEYKAQSWVHVIGDGERHAFRPDFLVPTQGLIIEVHGCYWHGCEDCFGDRALQKHVEGDHRRKAILEEAGYRMEWLWEHDIKSGVYLETLRKLLVSSDQRKIA